uniref:Cholinergic receptor nicotinic alpha 10 subunit n=1 Tax=Sarcophilus harrisii TaxID=9305 RepID=G3W2V9_SARHA
MDGRCAYISPFLLSGSQAAEGKLAQQLLHDLFTNYTSALRPVEDTDQALNVTLDVTLSQIIDMDERNQVLTLYLWIRQEWADAYLRWEPEVYGGLDSIRIPSSLVWRPDIVLYNKADTQPPASASTNVVLRHDGRVRWDAPAITRSSCRVDVAAFPFDSQSCRLTFGSWTHGGHQLELWPGAPGARLDDFVENVEWRVLGMPARRSVVTYGCCSEPYPDVTYTLLLQRRAAAYVANLLLPCVLISLLAPLAFHLPADSGEKVSLGVTVLLALTVFQLLLAENMPPAESVPLIGEREGGGSRARPVPQPLPPQPIPQPLAPASIPQPLPPQPIPPSGSAWILGHAGGRKGKRSFVDGRNWRSQEGSDRKENGDIEGEEEEEK